jgi:broad specificity phosphatase PhoE
MGRDHRVTFYRHGMTKYNERRRLSGLHNTVLTDAGRDQAKQISGLLAPRLNVVCCSALVRAIETMELALGLRRLHNTPIFIDPRLNEVCAGRYQGRSHRAVGAGRDRNIDGAPEGGESYRQAAARIFSFLIDLADQVLSCQTEQTRSAVFCHAGVLRIVLTLVHSPTRPAEMFEWRFENARGFEIELADVRLPGFWTNGNG